MPGTANQKIKILHIIKSLGRGGAEMLLPETLKLHDRSRFEFHYIYFLPWKNQLAGSIKLAGGAINCFSASNNFSILGQYKGIIRYIKKNDIHVMHAHLPWAGFVARLVHRFYGTPLIYTEHNKQERYHFLTRWLNRITFNWQSLVIAVSQDVADSIHKNIHPNVPVKLLLNGVNTDFFQRKAEEGKLIRQQFNIRPEVVVVGTVAVFRFQKRLKEWLEVFADASAKYPELVGIIVGDGPLKEELVDHSKRLKLEDKIVWPGLQTEVRPWYSAMDIFMMTSVFEGLPIALLEAMSMECTVVTTDAGGIKEVITHERDGLLVSTDQWQNLSAILDRLVLDQEKRKALGKAAREKVARAFGMPRMVEELEQLYSKQYDDKAIH